MKHHAGEINTASKRAIYTDTAIRYSIRERGDQCCITRRMGMSFYNGNEIHREYEDFFYKEVPARDKNYAVIAAIIDDDPFQINLPDCFASRLCGFLIEQIQNTRFTMGTDNRLCPEFYEFCTQKITSTEMYAETTDLDLLTIYIKQAVIILKKARLLINRNGCAAISEKEYYKGNLYVHLLTSFWNKVKWEDIFPSIPEAARELKRSRTILVDLCTKRIGYFPLSSVANEFFELTGFGNSNDFYLISFLDFYFFTWLKHFGIIRYIDERNSRQVKIAVTEPGIKIVSYLLAQ